MRTREIQRSLLAVATSVAAVSGCDRSTEATTQADGPGAQHALRNPGAAPMTTFNADSVARFAQLALDCVHREYPNKIAHVMNSDADAKPPRLLTPIFYGCFDWHSSVHGHWLLLRLARQYPDAPFAAAARAALDRSFNPEAVAAESEYMNVPGRVSFERPYGLAWLMQLLAEQHQWKDPQAQKWREILRPLENAAAKRLADWFPKLTFPIRTGEHSQTAFAMGLILDWARSTGTTALAELIVNRARDYYLADVGCNLAFEPGGQDFLSPCLAEADLMRRVLEPQRFARWLEQFLPDANAGGAADWLRPAVVSDKSDGKLAHLDGLNLSRAWMLEGIMAGLPRDDPRVARLRKGAALHRTDGLAAVGSEHYEGGHWLGSFSVYLVTERGLR